MDQQPLQRHQQTRSPTMPVHGAGLSERLSPEISSEEREDIGKASLTNMIAPNLSGLWSTGGFESAITKAKGSS